MADPVVSAQPMPKIEVHDEMAMWQYKSVPADACCGSFAPMEMSCRRMTINDFGDGNWFNDDDVIDDYANN